MSKLAPLVFIDTNVWFSAFYGSQNSEKLLKAHVQGVIRAAISKQVLGELVENVEKKIPKASQPLKRFLKAVPPMIIADPKDISRNVKACVEVKDQKIFQAALDARVCLFVTGNLKDFDTRKIYKKFGVKVVSPKEAVDILMQ